MWNVPRIRRPPLSAERARGSALSEVQVDEMWSLRARVIALRPETSLTQDRARFGAFVAESQRVLLLRDAQHVLRGMTCFLWEPVPDSSAVVVVPEYGFIEATHRGDPMYMLGGLPIVLRLWGETRRHSLWMAGIGYPKSMRSAARLMHRLWSLQDPDLPSEAEQVLRHVLARFGGPDANPHTGTTPLPTLPGAPPPVDRQGAFWHRYEALNPSWGEGVGLVLAGRVDARMLGRVVGDTGRRFRRAAT